MSAAATTNKMATGEVLLGRDSGDPDNTGGLDSDDVIDGLGGGFTPAAGDTNTSTAATDQLNC